MVVEKVHELISFQQSNWLDNFISFITEKRNISKTEFEKDFYKLINNGANGKFL